MLVGVDTGGTFTDLVAGDGTTAKVLSTRDDPAAAVAEGLRVLGERMGPGADPSGNTGSGTIDDPERHRPALLAHGTTVATNALLERRGATVALVTNAGFADVIEIARQDRPSLYDQWADRPEPLVARGHRYEVTGRLDAQGEELQALDLDQLPRIDPAVEAVAVSLLHADLDPAHERALARALAGLGHDVSTSTSVSPEFREYERTLTTVVNAYLRPACRAYLHRLGDLADEVLVMTSAGGLLPAGEAAELPAALLLSGPAGGVQAAAVVASANGWPDAVTFDMGGTSTDVCLVLGGLPEAAAGRHIAGFPIRLPSLDVHTIGAGGGSIAAIDPGGALNVGPKSAGADPGPACYGRGGVRPTVTDASLVAGHIPPDHEFPGLGRLDLAAARRALIDTGVTADGVLAVANASMVQAVRYVSVERGVDPRGLALVAFGGAGPLHACALADALGMPCVIVPARAGVLSAVGVLGAARQRDLVRSWPAPSEHDQIDEALVILATEASRQVGGGAEVTVGLDCRYAGQSHEITVPSIDLFAAEHERRNGYARPDAPIEVVALRATARKRSPVSIVDLPVAPGAANRKPISGAATIAEPDCTVWVPEGWTARPGELGALVLTRDGSATATAAPAADMGRKATAR